MPGINDAPEQVEPLLEGRRRRRDRHRRDRAAPARRGQADLLRLAAGVPAGPRRALRGALRARRVRAEEREPGARGAAAGAAAGEGCDAALRAAAATARARAAAGQAGGDAADEPVLRHQRRESSVTLAYRGETLRGGQCWLGDAQPAATQVRRAGARPPGPLHHPAHDPARAPGAAGAAARRPAHGGDDRRLPDARAAVRRRYAGAGGGGDRAGDPRVDAGARPRPLGRAGAVPAGRPGHGRDGVVPDPAVVPRDRRALRAAHRRARPAHAGRRWCHHRRRLRSRRPADAPVAQRLGPQRRARLRVRDRRRTGAAGGAPGCKPLLAAITLWTVGNLWWGFVLYDMVDPPFPSPADAGWLAFYPCAYLCIGLRLRERPRPPSQRLARRPGRDPVGRSDRRQRRRRAGARGRGGEPGGRADERRVPAGRPASARPHGRGAGAARTARRRYLVLLAAGFGLFAFANSLYLARLAADTYSAGTVLDSLWSSRS